jgi:hypothetical protein
MSNLLDLNEVLQKTQSVRMRIVDNITKEGIPTAKEDLDILNKTLDSLDKAVIAKKRLSIDENNSNNEQEASRLLATMLAQYQNPKLEKVMDNRNVEMKGSLRDSEVLPDETYVGVQEIDLDVIIKNSQES